MKFIKYKVQEHLFSFKPRYTITDDTNHLVGTINRNAFSFKKSAIVYNDGGEEVAIISRKFLSLKRVFYIYKDGTPKFRIFKTFSLKPTIFVESLSGTEAFYIQGDIWSSEFAFYRNNIEFAYVSRNIWKLNDAYQAAIKSDEDQFLILSIIIVLSLFRKKQ